MEGSTQGMWNPQDLYTQQTLTRHQLLQKTVDDEDLQDWAALQTPPVDQEEQLEVEGEAAQDWWMKHMTSIPQLTDPQSREQEVEEDLLQDWWMLQVPPVIHNEQEEVEAEMSPDRMLQQTPSVFQSEIQDVDARVQQDLSKSQASCLYPLSPQKMKWEVTQDGLMSQTLPADHSSQHEVEGGDGMAQDWWMQRTTVDQTSQQEVEGEVSQVSEGFSRTFEGVSDVDDLCIVVKEPSRSTSASTPPDGSSDSTRPTSKRTIQHLECFEEQTEETVTCQPSDTLRPKRRRATALTVTNRPIARSLSLASPRLPKPKLGQEPLTFHSAPSRSMSNASEPVISVPVRSLTADPVKSGAYTMEAATRLPYLSLGSSMNLRHPVWCLGTPDQKSRCFVTNGKIYPPGLRLLWRWCRNAVDDAYYTKWPPSKRRRHHPALRVKERPRGGKEERTHVTVEEIANRMMDAITDNGQAALDFTTTTVAEFPLPENDPRVSSFRDMLQGIERSVVDQLSVMDELPNFAKEDMVHGAKDLRFGSKSSDADGSVDGLVDVDTTTHQEHSTTSSGNHTSASQACINHLSCDLPLPAAVNLFTSNSLPRTLIDDPLNCTNFTKEGQTAQMMRHLNLGYQLDCKCIELRKGKGDQTWETAGSYIDVDGNLSGQGLRSLLEHREESLLQACQLKGITFGTICCRKTRNPKKWLRRKKYMLLAAGIEEIGLRLNRLCQTCQESQQILRQTAITVDEPV